jgi:hypothetical protein
MGRFGRTGGEGGSPPPNAGCFASLRGSASSRRRAVELFAMTQGNWNDGILEQCEGQPSTIPSFQFLLLSFTHSISNNEDNHRANIEHDQQRQNQPYAPIPTPHAAELIHEKLTHNGTRSNAITNKSIGK